MEQIPKIFYPNVISISKEEIPPVTDGEVEYKEFGIAHGAKLSLEDQIKGKISNLDEVQKIPSEKSIESALMLSSMRTFQIQEAWAPSNESLGVGKMWQNYIKPGRVARNINDNVLKDEIFDSREHCVQAIMNYFQRRGNKGAEKKKYDLILPMSGNFIDSFNFSGYVEVNQEIIDYEAKVYRIWPGSFANIESLDIKKSMAREHLNLEQEYLPMLRTEHGLRLLATMRLKPS